jgi:hypothetical protein
MSAPGPANEALHSVWGSASLDANQAAKLQRELARQLDYLRRLQRQINKRRWPADDPLTPAVDEAVRAVSALQFLASLLPGDLRKYRTMQETAAPAPPPHCGNPAVTTPPPLG